MKNCAIVCEYNPFHLGHKYQLDEVCRLGADNIFCMMSGSFVQSGLPALKEKLIRTECKIKGGEAAVIELPTVYATASAQIFAEGALKIISEIKNITHIAMGAVSDSSYILELSEIKTKHTDRFNSLLRAYLEKGISYNTASTAALAELYNELHPDKSSVETVLTDPNNILCIEYISAINKFAPHIEPIIIKRIGVAHNDKEARDGYISATAIRELEHNGQFEKAQSFIPVNFDKIKIARDAHAPDISAYKKIALFALKSSDTQYISRLRNCSEGLEYLLKSVCNSLDFDGIVSYVAGKRYSKKRILRLFLDIVLGIDKQATSKRFCTRLLACDKGLDFTLLPDCVKTNNTSIKNAASADTEISSILRYDEKATALYNTISRIDGDYYNYSLIKA